MEWAWEVAAKVIDWANWFVGATFMTMLLALVFASVFYSANFLEEWLSYEEE